MNGLISKQRFPIVWLMVGVGLWAASSFGNPVRIMPLGDSITKGYYTGFTTYNSYRKTLKQLLEDGSYETDFVGGESDGDFADIQHEGHNEWHADNDGTTDDILGRVTEWMTDTPADIILLHIGTNDIISEDEDAAEVSAILDKIFLANSNATVLLALIINADPDSSWGSNRYARVSTYNSNLNVMAEDRIAAGDDILVVDMEHDAGIDYASSDMVGFHPSPTGYNKMATNWYPAVTEAIARQWAYRAPYIDTLSVSNDAVVLHISNLSSDTAVHVEQGISLTNWSMIGSVTSAQTSATWIHPQGATNRVGFYRVLLP